MAVLQYKYIQISKIIQVGGLNQRLHAFLAAFIDGRDLKRGRKVCCCSHMLARQICRRSYTNKKPAVCSLQTNYSGPVNSPSTVLMDMVSTQNSLFWYLDFVSFGLTKSQDTTRHDMQSFSQAKRRSAWDNEMKSSRSPSLTPPLKAMELAHLNPPKKNTKSRRIPTPPCGPASIHGTEQAEPSICGQAKSENSIQQNQPNTFTSTKSIKSHKFTGHISALSRATIHFTSFDSWYTSHLLVRYCAPILLYFKA